MLNNLVQYKKINGLDIAIYNSVAFSKLHKAGQLAKQTLDHIQPFVTQGVSTDYLNTLIHNFIIQHNAIPATLGYMDYPKSCCISINNEICHGIPSNRILKEGDILNIDVTVILDGFYGDTSKMYTVGKISKKAQKLIDVTTQCLMQAIEIVKPNVRLGDIGSVIENIAHKNGFSVVEDFCGHGIGHVFHQPPNVLHFGKAGTGLTLQEGMVFTIEPMINIGKKHSVMLKNGWTAVTRDSSLSAQQEHTIGVTSNGCTIFTQ